MARCDGCPHNWYSAPGGQQGYPGCEQILTHPHSRCTYLDAYIPIVIEKIRGCDGTSSNVWVRSQIPDDCPVHGTAAQKGVRGKTGAPMPVSHDPFISTDAYKDTTMGIQS